MVPLFFLLLSLPHGASHRWEGGGGLYKLLPSSSATSKPHLSKAFSLPSS
jgi:hypothetical protein